MARINDTKQNRHLSVKLAAGLVLSGFLMSGTFVVPASAQGRPRDDHRERDRRDDRGGPGWTGGYYTAPPVVYASPYYNPPPIVYGPTVGIVLPGVNVIIR